MRKTGCAPSDLLVDLDAVRDLSSGVSKYRDFIRYLPIHLSKYILSMLGCTGGFLKSPPIAIQFEGFHVCLLFFFRYAR